jgi:hypothetical protein
MKEMEINWVRARNACSTQQMFERLKADIQEDVKTRNDLVPKHPEFGFPFGFRVVEAANSLRIVREGIPPLVDAVVITLNKESITVSDPNGQIMLTATVTLNDEGNCVFRVKNEERELWQFRKMALEKLFFDVG